jgi:nucleoside-diphosphate-sugar epimerase
MVYGPNFPGSASVSHLGQSASDIYSLMNGTLSEAPSTRMPVYVDVREAAEAHRLAFESEQSGRFALCAGNYTKPAICRMLRDSGLGLEDRVPSQGLHAEDDTGMYTVDSSRVKQVLGLRFRPIEETFLDMAKVRYTHDNDKDRPDPSYSIQEFLAMEKKETGDGSANL